MMNHSPTTPLELIFSQDFFIHALDASSTSNHHLPNESTTTQQQHIPQLQDSIRAREIKLLPNNDSTPTLSYQRLPTTNYLQHNPLITGRYFNTPNDINPSSQISAPHRDVPSVPLPPLASKNHSLPPHQHQSFTPELSNTIVDSSRNDEGLLLPKCFILTHKLNPLSVDEYIETMNTVMRKVRELQLDQHEKLKHHIPHVHLMNGFSVEGILAILNDSGVSHDMVNTTKKNKPVFIPFESYRMQLYEDIFGRVLKEGTNQARVEEWFANIILSKISEGLGSGMTLNDSNGNNSHRVVDETNHSEEEGNNNAISSNMKFHFFTFIQTYGYWAIPLSDQSSAFDVENSPLRRLNQILGFRRSKM
ncbi:hypothetical protein C9374_014198 [Naegleria lovaniensis]|uniref:Uncharacterized protein n=1 Tax=Naegleria lovaniensis TaxID=51637 RepID=A0AA88H282_NAELO|nr:uncharacterized protein C9374_014198 [Naegleria lovaniensis]KAG2389638.1 hypothetical protein C9374_014198 [Naegleria lovaniensis]